MTVLGTNVLSEALRPAPSPVVLSWLAGQHAESVFTTTITVAEVLYWIEVLPAGKRKVRLATAIEAMFSQELQNRILPFYVAAARAFSRIVATRKSVGRPISLLDAMIAAIAHSQRASVATRNAADFEGCGIPVVNPWSL